MVIVFALAAMALVWLALFGDKPRGKARCPRCWYELGTLASPPALPVTCPECGKRVERPRQLSRRRFGRWTMLAAWFLSGVAWIGWKLPEIDERGWLWLVPNRVLYEVLPMVGNTSALGEELQRRAGLAPWKNLRSECTMDDQQLAAFLTRAARGNALARPMSLKWRDTYGSMIVDIIPRFEPELEALAKQSTGAGSASDTTSPALLQAFKELRSLPPVFDVKLKGEPGCASGALFSMKLILWWPCVSCSYEEEWDCKAETGEVASCIGGGLLFRRAGLWPHDGDLISGDGKATLAGRFRVRFAPIGAEQERAQSLQWTFGGNLELDHDVSTPLELD